MKKNNNLDSMSHKENVFTPRKLSVFEKVYWQKMSSLKEKVSSDNFKNIKAVAVLSLMLLALVSGLRLVQQRQDVRTEAETTEVILSLVPSKATVEPGETFDVSVLMDTKSMSVSAVKLQLSLDPSMLSIDSFDQLTFLPVTLISASVTESSASITLGSNPDSPVNGSGVIVRLTLTAGILEGSTEVVFDQSTQVAAIGYDSDVIFSLEPTIITIQSPVGSPIPTPDSCSSCFKGVCDGVCRKNDGSSCLDCAPVEATCSSCFKGVCDGVCRKNDGSSCLDCL